MNISNIQLLLLLCFVFFMNIFITVYTYIIIRNHPGIRGHQGIPGPRGHPSFKSKSN